LILSSFYILCSYETAKSLYQQGNNIVFACRDEARANGAIQRLASSSSSSSAPGKLSFEKLDLADLSSVKDFTKRYLDSGRPIDVLLNNAGVMAPPLMRTKDGFELQLGVNHLGHFALTLGLSPLLTDPNRSTRVVNVASTAHLFGSINFDDLNSERDYNNWKAYGQSKLANILFTYALARRLNNKDNCTATTLHPGVVATELSRYLLPENPNFFQKAAIGVLEKFILTPAQGAETSIFLASSPEVDGVSGKYFDQCKAVTSSKESYDLDVARRLWDISVEKTGAELTHAA